VLFIETFNVKLDSNLQENLLTIGGSVEASIVTETVVMIVDELC
jgi:hypothetical protein